MDNNTSKNALEGVLFVIGVLAVGVVAFPFLIIGFFSLLAFLEGDTRREFSMPGICRRWKGVFSRRK